MSFVPDWARKYQWEARAFYLHETLRETVAPIGWLHNWIWGPAPWYIRPLAIMWPFAALYVMVCYHMMS